VAEEQNMTLVWKLAHHQSTTSAGDRTRGLFREFKSREVAQRQKNNVISGFIRSLVLNTLIFIDAIATWRLEWCTAVCSLLMIVWFCCLIYYFGLCRPFVVCGVHLFKCLYLKMKPGVALSVSEAPDAVSRVHVDLACNGPLVVYSLDDQYVQYSAKRGLQRGLRTPQVYGLGKGV